MNKMSLSGSWAKQTAGFEVIRGWLGTLFSGLSEDHAEKCEKYEHTRKNKKKIVSTRAGPTKNSNGG